MKQLFGIAIFIFFCYGCKKSDNDIISTCRLTSVITPTTNDTFHIIYNNEGKISAVTFKTIVSNFFYSGNTTTITKVINGLYSGRTVVTNNANGLAINVKTEFNAAGTEWANTTYEYNGEELFRSTSTHSGGGTPSVTAYAWINHNLISITAGATIIRLEYDLDKPGQEGDYLFLQGLLSGYDLYRSKNLLKSIDGAIFTYTRKADGKITSIEIGPTTVYKYEYECN